MTNRSSSFIKLGHGWVFERLEQNCIKKGRSCWFLSTNSSCLLKKYEKLIYRGVHLRYCGLTAWTDNGSALSLSLSLSLSLWHTHTISLTHSSRLLSLSPIASHDLCQSEDSKEILNFLLLVKSRRNRRKMKRQDVWSKQLRANKMSVDISFVMNIFFPEIMLVWHFNCPQSAQMMFSVWTHWHRTIWDWQVLCVFPPYHTKEWEKINRLERAGIDPSEALLFWISKVWPLDYGSLVKNSWWWNGNIN